MGELIRVTDDLSPSHQSLVIAPSRGLGKNVFSGAIQVSLRLKMRSKLKISSCLLEEIVRDSLTEDREVCGFLLGTMNDESFKVVELYKAKNISQTNRVRFEVDPTSVYETHRYADEVGLEVIGVYHSHPGPPVPSTIDLEGMKNWPVAWLIVSSVDGSVAAYTMEDGFVRELEVLLE